MTRRHAARPVLAAGAAAAVLVALGACATAGGLAGRSGDPARALDTIRCGDGDETLRAAVAASTTLTVDADTSAPARHGMPYSFHLDLTNATASPLRGSLGYPWVLVTRDGKVVGALGGGVPAVAYSVDLPAHGDGPPGGYGAATVLAACAGRESASDAGGDLEHAPQLPPGQYELWAVLSVTVQAHGADPALPGATTAPAVDDLTVAGGPWPLTIG